MLTFGEFIQLNTSLTINRASSLNDKVHFLTDFIYPNHLFILRVNLNTELLAQSIAQA